MVEMDKPATLQDQHNITEQDKQVAVTLDMEQVQQALVTQALEVMTEQLSLDIRSPNDE